jgi:HK97 family phage major capsid protein
MTLQELKNKHRDDLNRASLIVQRAEVESRGMSADEQRLFNELMEGTERLRDEIDRAEGRGRHYIVPDVIARGVSGDPPARGEDGRPIVTGARIDPSCPVLTRSQRVTDYLAAAGRGPVITERFSVGELVLSSLTGRRDRLTPSEERALAAGTGVAGGFILEGQPAGMVIDLLRPATRVLQAGASIVPMTEGTLKLAKVLTADQPTWHVENADDIADSGLTFGALVLTTKTLPVIATCSVELVEDLNSNMMAQAIETELVRSLAQELDRSALRGSGTGTEHVRGLLNMANVTKTELGSGNGLETTDYDWIVEAIGRIWAQNLEPSAWLTSSAVATRIEKYKSTADAQPLRAPRAVEQLPRLITNQIPSDLTVGGSSDCSEAYFGAWSDMLIGMRTSIRVEATRVAGDAFKKMQVLIRAYLRADVGIARGESFQVVTGVRD